MIFDLSLVFLIGAAAGMLGSLTGLGGGIVIVPLLILVVDLPVKEAISLSLCAIAATSITSVVKYLPQQLVDVKAALDLEITAAFGSFVVADIAGLISSDIVAMLFSGLLIYSAAGLFVKRSSAQTTEIVSKQRYFSASFASLLAGGAVGLLGIGGGVVKVPILHFLLKKEIKRAAATSTLMVGISASAGVIPYLQRGDLNFSFVPHLALGALVGAFVGSKYFHRIESRWIKRLLAAALIYTAVNMLLEGIR